jgi:hypothetical protein
MPEKDFFDEVLTRLPKAMQDAVAVRTAEMLEDREMDHEFALVLTGIGDLDDELMDALHEAGCDDCTPVLRNGEVVLTFARAAATRGEAISDAIRDVRSSGLGVDVLRVDD